jgi:hypothetical protein
MKRIRYVSQFARDMTRADIDDLVDRSAGNNARLGITGILMTSGRMFFQILEGPPEHVDRVFARIAADERHQDVLLLSAEEDAGDRYFPDWSMRKVDLDASADARMRPIREALRQIIEKRLEIDQLVHTLERAVWSELASAID